MNHTYWKYKHQFVYSHPPIGVPRKHKPRRSGVCGEANREVNLTPFWASLSR